MLNTLTGISWKENVSRPEKGGMPQMVGEYVLNKHKIDPHKDIDLIQNIDFANIANAFASGTGEYVQLFEPQASLFEKKASAIS